MNAWLGSGLPDSPFLEDLHDYEAARVALGLGMPPQKWVDELIDEQMAASFEAGVC